MKTPIQTNLDQTVKAINEGDYQGYIDSLITLATAIKEKCPDYSDYYSGDTSLWDLLDASYHHLLEYHHHRGQYSWGCVALSTVSNIYEPCSYGIYEESEGLKQLIDSMI